MHTTRLARHVLAAAVLFNGYGAAGADAAIFLVDFDPSGHVSDVLEALVSVAGHSKVIGDLHASTKETRSEVVLANQSIHTNHTVDAGVWPSGRVRRLVDFVRTVVGSNPTHG